MNSGDKQELLGDLFVKTNLTNTHGVGSSQHQLDSRTHMTAEVVLPGGTGKINVTIDYEYDDLNRITSAIYTDTAG